MAVSVEVKRVNFADASGDLIGAHMSTRGGLESAFERAVATASSAIALFAKNGNQWKGKPLTDEGVATFVEARRRNGYHLQPVMTHASYLINLATTNEEFHRKSLAALADELERAERLGCFAVVLHPGAHMGAGAAAGLDQIARSLDQVHRSTPGLTTVALLESAAGQGSCVGCSFEELGTILRLVDEPDRVGVCIDTCHIFAAGYDLRTEAAYERTIDELLEQVGLDNVAAFHLNDSKKGLGSRVDRHQHIGEGELGIAPFEFLLNDARFRHVPKVLETPKSEPPDEHALDQKNLATLRAMVRQEVAKTP